HCRVEHVRQQRARRTPPLRRLGHRGGRRTVGGALFPCTTLFRSGLRALPEWAASLPARVAGRVPDKASDAEGGFDPDLAAPRKRSEEHTSELQSRENLVCRLLLEKKKGYSNAPSAGARPPVRLLG